jgi:hypothetical protein
VEALYAELAELDRRGRLERDLTVANIEQIFGHEFLSQNEKGTSIISGGVMKAFWRLTENSAIWEPKNRAWVKLKANEYQLP